MRWGILGAARIAQTEIVPAIQCAREAELVALATRRPERAAEFQALVPGLRLHDSYAALIDDPEVDAVYIPLPNHLHVPWSLRAAQAGKHVLCEKPIALSAPEIDQLIAARETTGKLIAEAFMVAHHPQWDRVRSLLDEGAIGPLEHVEGCFTYLNRNLADIRHDRTMGGGGLRDVGVYPCVTTRRATQAEPTRLHAEMRLQNGVDTFARVWAEFPSFTMSFYCGMGQSPRQYMTFHGQDGWLHLTAPFSAQRYGDTVLQWREGRATHVENFNNAQQYTIMIENFTASALHGTPFACPLEDSRANQAMIDAILKSAAP